MTAAVTPIWRLWRANAAVLRPRKWAFFVMLPMALAMSVFTFFFSERFSDMNYFEGRDKDNIRRDNEDVAIAYYSYALVLNMFRLWCVPAAMVNERETRIRDVLRTLGLKDRHYYFAWMLAAMLEPVFYFTVFWILVMGGIVREPQSSSPLLVWLLSLAVNFACAGLSLLMGVICSDKHWVSILCLATTAYTWTKHWQYGLYHVHERSERGSEKADALAKSLWELVQFPQKMPPVVGQAYFLRADKNWEIMVATLLRMLFGAVCLVLAMYLDQVLPRKWGVMPPRSPLFLLRWLKAKQQRDADDRNDVASAAATHVIEVEMARATPAMLRTASAAEDTDLAEPMLRDEEMTLSPSIGSHGPYHGQVFEPLGPQREALLQRCEGVQVCKLRKVFKGDIVAVADLSFAMVPGEVFCLLGQNGAGKTTAISMIAGILPPTGGNAVVFKEPVWGPNGLVSRGNCRQSFGICTQENMLIPFLRLKDHLILACHIRGVGVELVDPMLDRFGLTSHKDMHSAQLSGGTARRMNLAMAFASTRSRTIILDEPSGGVDPQSRRAIMRTIADLKQDRVVLMSTHYLEEAEILADQVAILSRGRLCCAGSTDFLKRHYGCGYLLTFDLEDPTTVQAVMHRVFSIIGHEPEKLKTEPSLLLRVPFSASQRFPELYECLYAERGTLGILAFGVSITSLEEVFVNISDRNGEAKDASTMYRMPSNGETLHLKRGQPSCLQQSVALARFHLTFAWKTRAQNIARILLPIAICCCFDDGPLVQLWGTWSLLVMMVVGLYRFTANGAKRNQMSNGCGIWTWHLVYALIEGVVAAMSMYVIDAVWSRRYGWITPAADWSKNVADPVLVLLDWAVGVTWTLHASFLMSLRSIITRRLDHAPSVTPLVDALVYMGACQAAGLLPVLTRVYRGVYDGGDLTAMLVQFFAVWGLAGLIDWLLLRPGGRKCVEKLRKVTGYVCFLGMPYCLGRNGDDRRDPQAHLEADVIMDESSRLEAERVQTEGPECKRLWVSGLSKVHTVFRFGCWKSRTKVTALRNVSFQMNEGILGLLGVNGAGKSTLLKIIVGEEHATTGSVSIEKDVGYCCQETALYPKLTAMDHLMFYGRLRGLPQGSLAGEVHKVLRTLAIREDDAKKPVGNLSGGHQRRIMVGLAIIGSPNTLVLDEPSSGVDAVTKRFMWEQLQRLSLEKMVLYVSHSMEEVEALCSRVAILDKGVVRCIGTPADLAEEYGAGFWEVAIKLAPQIEVVQQKMRSIGAERDDLPIEMLFHRNRFQFEDEDGASARLLSSASSFPHMREVMHACLDDAAPQTHVTTGRILMAAVTEDRAASGISALDLAWALATEAAGLKLQASCPFDCALEAASAQSWRFRVRLDAPDIGQLFAWLEVQKGNMQNFEYNIFQTTLESVFQSIVRQSEESV